MSLLNSAVTFRQARAARLRARGLRHLASRLCLRCVEHRERAWAIRELARLDRWDREEALISMRWPLASGKRDQRPQGGS